MHIYICIIYWAANSRLTLTAFFKRLLLTRCFLKQTKILLQKKKRITPQSSIFFRLSFLANSDQDPSLVHVFKLLKVITTYEHYCFFFFFFPLLHKVLPCYYLIWNSLFIWFLKHKLSVEGLQSILQNIGTFHVLCNYPAGSGEVSCTHLHSRTVCTGDLQSRFYVGHHCYSSAEDLVIQKLRLGCHPSS